jgi:rhamnosyltransferase
MAARFSVVIRAFNEEEHIGRLLSGLLEQTLRPADVLLVDSGSTDATVSIASRFPVKVLSIQPEEFSFGRSLNVGCRAASGELIVVASGHIYPVYPDWLEQLLAPFADPEVALVYGRQRGGEATRFSEHQVLAKWFPEVSDPRQAHPFCNNANAAIRRNLWEKRPYNEDLPGLEDVEWATWAQSQGHAIAYSAAAEVVHIHNEAPRAVFNRYQREAMALKSIRPQEQFRLPDFVRLYASNVLSDLWHAAQDGRLPGVVREILWFRWMQFGGTYRGFRCAGPLSDALSDALKQTFYYPRAFERQVAARREVAPIDYGRGGRLR